LKPSTYQCLAHQALTSSSSSAAVTATVPPGTSAVLITVETTSCRWTLTPSGDPTSGTGLILQPANNPYLVLVGQDAVLRFASTGAAASVIQLAYLG
jgi:hypothetical protein